MDSSGLWHIVKTNRIELPTTGKLFRVPPRAKEFLEPDYFLKYDGLTLVSDIFLEGTELHLVAPPLLNLKEDMGKLSLVCDGRRISVPDDAWSDADRMSRMHLDIGAPVDEVTFEFAGQRHTVRPGRSWVEVFRGRNVAVTVNKDNHLQTIVDWVRNYTHNHGVTAAVIYDNRSDSYSMPDLLAAMKTVPGLEVCVVVDWPDKFGNLAGASRHWDSDFGQYIAWEHARWRFARQARCVFQGDADEFPITGDGRSMQAHLEESDNGALFYQVQNMSPVPRAGLDPNREDHRHSDYLHADAEKELFSRKVCYRPDALKDSDQVANHSINGIYNHLTEKIIARHVLGVHRGWRSENAAFYDVPDRELEPGRDRYDARAETVYRDTFPEAFKQGTPVIAEVADRTKRDGDVKHN